MELEAGPPFSRILAPVDGLSISEIAVRRSQALLALPGCRITLLHVGGDDETRRRVENLASEARGWGADVDVRIRSGAPVDEILREIEAGGHDLVAMTSRRRSRVLRNLPGKVALEVLRRSPVPLLLYRPLAGLDESFFAVEKSEPAKFRKLILMLDGSDRAEVIVELTHRLARAFQSELILFQALHRDEVSEDRMESVRAYLAERAHEAHRLGISTRIQIVIGDPAEQALRLLEGSADAVALTTRGRSTWGSTILGSVTNRILSAAEGPILCVASPEVRKEWGRENRSSRSRKSPSATAL